MKSMSTREKIMLAVLGVMCLALVYYYLLYIPMKEEIAQYKEEYNTVDDTLILVDAKAAQLATMKAELEAIKQDPMGATKALPAYDNRQNLMSQLSNILSKTQSYNIIFGNVSGDGTTVSRQITLNYSCGSYEEAKSILQEIHNGEYPCVFGTLHLSNNGATISIQITYFEYGKLNQ